MAHRKSKVVFWLLFLAFVVFVCVRGFSQGAVDVFQQTQDAEYFDSKDDGRDWMMYHMATMFDAQTTRIEALQEDVREIRSQNTWILRLLAGGGGAGVLGGGAIWRKRRNGAAVIKRRRK